MKSEQVLAIFDSDNHRNVIQYFDELFLPPIMKNYYSVDQFPLTKNYTITYNYRTWLEVWNER